MTASHVGGVCAIAVMAKAPRAGEIKTRLTPVLGSVGAAALGAAFLTDVTANVACASERAPIHGYVAFAPAGAEACFVNLVAPSTRLVLADGAGPAPADVTGFGRALLDAISVLLGRGYGAVCVLNADSPTLPTDSLVKAAAVLLAPGDRAVLGAAEDGGYWALGMKRRHTRLLADIVWSTAEVAKQTRARAREIALSVTELPSWYDVDSAPSLRRLIRDLEPRVSDRGEHMPFAAPATAACLARLGLVERLVDS